MSMASQKEKLWWWRTLLVSTGLGGLLEFDNDDIDCDGVYDHDCDYCDQEYAKSSIAVCNTPFHVSMI